MTITIWTGLIATFISHTLSLVILILHERGSIRRFRERSRRQRDWPKARIR